MDNSNGARLRAVFRVRLPDIAVSLIEQHANASPEVKRLLQTLHDAVSVAYKAEGNPADGLSAVIDALCTSIDRHAFMFVTPEMLQLMGFLRHIIAITKGTVTRGDPAGIVSRAHRFQLQQQLVPSNSLMRQTAQQPPLQHVWLPSRYPQQALMAMEEEEQMGEIEEIEEEEPVMDEEEQMEEEEQQSEGEEMPGTSQAAKKSKERALPIVAKGSSVSINHSKPKSQKAKCKSMYCNSTVAVDKKKQLNHVWQKHRHLIYKFTKPELVCTSNNFCDYVASSEKARKSHEVKVHKHDSPYQYDLIQDFEEEKRCTYCGFRIYRIGYVKKHMTWCTMRDERAFLGCSACPEATFHTVLDFTTHLKENGGFTHAKPVMMGPQPSIPKSDKLKIFKFPLSR